jgi:hypothetical protein
MMFGLHVVPFSGSGSISRDLWRENSNSPLYARSFDQDATVLEDAIAVACPANDRATVLRLKGWRWYDDRPGASVKLRERLVNVPGNAGLAALPRQVACSVTFRTTPSGFSGPSLRRHWGRIYLPTLSTSNFPAGNIGELGTGAVDAIVARWVALFTSQRAAADTNGFALMPIVYHSAKPQRQTKAGATLPATTEDYHLVDNVEVDSVPDVVRRRRPSSTTYRVVTPVTYD